jgi:hypothetical protein
MYKRKELLNCKQSIVVDDWTQRNNCCRKSYSNVEDKYTDAHVASLCCKGGAISYELKTGIAVSDEWLFTIVIPNIYD